SPTTRPSPVSRAARWRLKLPVPHAASRIRWSPPARRSRAALSSSRPIVMPAASSGRPPARHRPSYTAETSRQFIAADAIVRRWWPVPGARVSRYPRSTGAAESSMRAMRWFGVVLIGSFLGGLRRRPMPCALHRPGPDGDVAHSHPIGSHDEPRARTPAPRTRKAPMERSALASHSDGLHLHTYRWSADSPKAIVQIAHGLAEHAPRYDRLARALTAAGYEVYSHDHRGHGGSVSDEVR